MLLSSKQQAIFFDCGNKAGRPVDRGHPFLRMRAVRLLAEDGDLRQAVSLSRTGRTKGGWFSDNDTSRFDRARRYEVTSADTADLLIRSQY